MDDLYYLQFYCGNNVLIMASLMCVKDTRRILSKKILFSRKKFKIFSFLSESM